MFCISADTILLVSWATRLVIKSLVDCHLYLVDQFVLLEVFWEIFPDQFGDSVVLPHEEHVHAAHDFEITMRMMMMMQVKMMFHLVRKGCSFTLSSPATKSAWVCGLSWEIIILYFQNRLFGNRMFTRRTFGRRLRDSMVGSWLVTLVLATRNFMWVMKIMTLMMMVSMYLARRPFL